MTIGVAGGAGALNYSAADLAGLGANWSSIRLGSTTAIGALTVGANAWDSPCHLSLGGGGVYRDYWRADGGSRKRYGFPLLRPDDLGSERKHRRRNGRYAGHYLQRRRGAHRQYAGAGGQWRFLFSGTIDGAFDLTLNAAGTITLSDDLGASTPLDDLTLASDADPTIGGTVNGTGVLTLQQASNATTMGVAGGAGALNYSVADIAGLGTNWTSIAWAARRRPAR